MCYIYLFLCLLVPSDFFFFFFNDTATTEIYTLSLHDALPIYPVHAVLAFQCLVDTDLLHGRLDGRRDFGLDRSEEHTSELQSPCNLVCRLLLEKKKKKQTKIPHHFLLLSHSHPTTLIQATHCN